MDDSRARRVTGAELELSTDDQILIALREIARRGGEARMSEIYEAVEEELGECFLPHQVKASLRRVVRLNAVEAGYLYPPDPCDAGWRITAEGREFLKACSSECDDGSGIEIDGRDSQPLAVIARPFSTIFLDREEADWAFDLLKEAFRILEVTGPEDERFSLGFRKNHRILRLSFGDWWGVLQFVSRDYSKYNVGLALIQEQAKQTSLSMHWKPFEGTEDELPISMYRFPIDTARPFNGKLREAFESTFAHIAERFRHLEVSPYRRDNVMEIAEAVFDRKKRSELLTAGLRLS